MVGVWTLYTTLWRFMVASKVPATPRRTTAAGSAVVMTSTIAATKELAALIGDSRQHCEAHD